MPTSDLEKMLACAARVLLNVMAYGLRVRLSAFASMHQCKPNAWDASGLRACNVGTSACSLSRLTKVVMMCNICLQTYLVSNLSALLTRADVGIYTMRHAAALEGFLMQGLCGFAGRLQQITRLPRRALMGVLQRLARSWRVGTGQFAVKTLNTEMESALLQEETTRRSAFEAKSSGSWASSAKPSTSRAR